MTFEENITELNKKAYFFKPFEYKKSDTYPFESASFKTDRWSVNILKNGLVEFVYYDENGEIESVFCMCAHSLTCLGEAATNIEQEHKKENNQ